jgi:hypothetical protein
MAEKQNFEVISNNFHLAEKRNKGHYKKKLITESNLLCDTKPFRYSVSFCPCSLRCTEVHVKSSQV